MAELLRDLVLQEEGQNLPEYALIISLLAIALLAALTFLGGQTRNVFSNVGNNLT